MQDNSKQEPEGFFSLMFQFSLMMLVFWLICCLLKPLFPEEKELGEYDENGKRNFQYACDYRTINEEESEDLEEIFSNEEFTDASYNVERFINDVYSMMVPVYNKTLSETIEISHIEVKQYNFFADTYTFVSEVDGEYVLVLEDTIESTEDISDELKHEIMICLTEIYSKEIELESMTTVSPFATIEEKEFGPGIKRLVYEDMLSIYLEENRDLISFFLNNQIPEFNKYVLEESYDFLEGEYDEIIMAKANLRGFYTAMEALEMHLRDYYELDENEHAYICCLELALMPGLIEENGVRRDYAYELISQYVPTQYWSYLSKLI